ncbi:MAG: OmpH family outer membrane protein [Gammaproteobacteria bacterium]|nr:OmpH family outer membrane protein [Gammaproteobacteria bacterium]
MSRYSVKFPPWQLLLLLSSFIGVVGVAEAADAAVKVAFVNTAELLERSPHAEKLRTKLQEEFAGRDGELVKMQQKIKGMEERIARDGSIMSKDEQRELERDLLQEQRNFKRLRDEFSEDLTLRQNEELKKIQFEMAQVVVEVAQKQGFDIVLESGVVYASDRVNITDAVITALKQRTKK